MRIFDCFPFFNELDVLEIRLHEMAPLVDKFIILEAGETYGGHPKPFNLENNWDRFAQFHSKMYYRKIKELQPKCVDRTSGRLRESYQRDQMYPILTHLGVDPNDIIIFSDCDEIPRMTAVHEAIPRLEAEGILRMKQRSYYYTVNCLIDYGRDICSRARMGTFKQLQTEGGMYNFRMYRKNDCPVVEEGGWHFSYFGDVDGIKNKVASLSQFLAEYKLYGDGMLVQDMVSRKDLHHRPAAFSQLPEQFQFSATNDPMLPVHLLANSDRFRCYTEKYLREKYYELLQKGGK